MRERHEHRSTDDGPKDGEGMPVDVHDQQFGKAERVGHRGPDERTDEADGDRNDKTATYPACNGASKSAAHASDEQKNEQTRECDGHISRYARTGPAR